MTLAPPGPLHESIAFTPCVSAVAFGDPIRFSLDDLLDPIAAGHQRAFEFAYPHLVPLAYGVALRVFRNFSHAERITQEALIDVWLQAMSHQYITGLDPHG
jgi:hypothetical protein